MGLIQKGPASSFRRDGNNDFTSKSGDELTADLVAQVLGTREGSLPWRPGFGSKLYRLLHASGPSLIFVAQFYVVSALEKWLPDVRLTRFSARLTDGTLFLRIDYRLVRNGIDGAKVTGQTLSIQA